MSLKSFFTRIDSPRSFVLIAGLGAGLCDALVRAFLIRAAPEVAEIHHGPIDRLYAFGPVAYAAGIFLLGPLFLSLVILAVVESARRLRLALTFQILAAAAALCGLTWLLSAPQAILLLPVDVLFAFTYVNWRVTSLRTAFTVTFLLQVCSNLLPALGVFV